MKPRYDKFVDNGDIFGTIDTMAEERSHRIDMVLDEMNKTEALLIKKITLSDWSIRRAARELKRSRGIIARKLKKAHGNFKAIYREIFKDN